MKKNNFFYKLIFFILVFTHKISFSQNTKIKDMASIKGVRTNSLIGYGLVIGLSGTGDSGASLATKRSLSKAFAKLGIYTTPEEIVSGNIASVIVTASLPPFARNGDRIDIRLSAIGDSKSLAGGTLLLTPLLAGDGKVYAATQGPVTIGQPGSSPAGILTVANIVSGGIVEREYLPDIVEDNRIQLNLKHADFTSANSVVKSVNKEFRGFFATSKDPSSVTVEIPIPFAGDIVSFISKLENIFVEVDRKAVVVINERTGTVVMGNTITISPVTIAHGDLSISILAKDSDPKSKSKGKSSKVSLTQVEGTSVGELVEALNGLGVKPKDLVSIFQAIKASSSLNADLEFL